MWYQRAVQVLLANGVAVVTLNPYIHDAFDYFSTTHPGATPQQAWDMGLDKPFLVARWAADCAPDTAQPSRKLVLVDS